ncbi:neutral/alkaline ceramidase [Amycolatopsis cynarae]|uniref:Neutral ceramidase n=1 Tax=Amycolatopsis cynarae TaxID=2995223 RepID=A0ABY7AW15_9PSEU|nr:neutral/alkaline ceramidase [Amycolatopsis sp. HUAS 11-8]WAL63384.1 neutral/alkaline ceramidase [Amycolatopsis sp. HUAS 11-8]
MTVSRRRMLAGAAIAPLAMGVFGGGAQAVAASAANDAPQGDYLVGAGVSDVTGPAAECGMMGYSMPQQQTAGIHQRTRARAYIVADASGRRVCYVNADVGALFQSVHQGVIARLQARYGGLYTEQNTLLNATHTHAGCGGSSWYAAYNLSILGFQQQTYDAQVDGIVEAIERAHDNLAPGRITLGRTELTDASVNRSRVAFELNPQADKDHFPLSIDPAVTVLRFSQGGRDIGAIAWFATHGTSMTNANKLISGDNKGYAAYAWEHDQAGVRYLDGTPGFVACFPQTNSGDMSPNLNLKPGSGPTEDEFENTRIIGERQFLAAKRAYDAADETIGGPLDYRLHYVDMSKVTVDGRYTPDGQQHTTASAAIGVSMLAGSTEDGPGLPLPEGVSNPFIDALGGVDSPVGKELADAQAPKVIAVPFGQMKPYPWAPEVLPLQIIRLGQLYLVGGPAEYTIVAGLRIRRTVAAELGVPLENVIMQGYANAYSQYVTTPEEYDSQQYEGASTLFGRYTLPAYQQEFAGLAAAMRTGAAVDHGPVPRDLSQDQLNFQPGVVMDSAPLLKKFGDVLTEAKASYQRGEQVLVEFVTGHPKNDLHRNGTFLEIQRLVDGTWVRHADDGDWDTKFHWTRTVLAESKATITWDIPPATPVGKYRVVHHGDWKSLAGTITPFTGTSRAFVVS